MITSTKDSVSKTGREDYITNNLKDLISVHRFFKGLDPTFLPFLESVARYAEYGPGELILNEAAEADGFHLVLWGAVGLEAHIPGKSQVTVQRIGVGEALGWSWFFPPHSWRFSARTLTATEVITFDVTALRDYANKNHDFGYDLALRMGQLMHERLKAACALLEDYCR
ncbi:MAG TPA: cyclic nucleotide-binding domain-containing protein [Chthoniobacteraceae bacterium]|nr:cyclic nucleotide-binding domain-containing protein [Chthoniobacteraceae bacterium]